jgi:hypothetical protein
MQCSVCGELDLPVEGQPADACAASAQYAACAQHSCITVCYLPGLDLEPLVLSSSCLPCAALHIQQCGIRQLGECCLRDVWPFALGFTTAARQLMFDLPLSNYDAVAWAHTC